MKSFLATSLLRLWGKLPLSALHAIGASIGRLMFIIPNRRQRTARTNLALCFPEMSADAREQLLHRNLIELGKSVFEVCRIWTADKMEINRLVRHVYGEDVLKQKMREGKGVILGVPHMGAWELIGQYCSLNYPMTSLFRPQSSATGTFVHQARQRFGAHLVPTDNNGIRALYKALERGEMIAILPDQVPAQRGGGVFAPFFGIPASTMVLLSRLAIKTGAAVLFAYADRLSDESKFDLHFIAAPPEINHADIEVSVAAVNRMVEHCARARPEQYQWFYKRFRVRPPGEAALY